MNMVNDWVSFMQLLVQTGNIRVEEFNLLGQRPNLFRVIRYSYKKKEKGVYANFCEHMAIEEL